MMKKILLIGILVVFSLVLKAQYNHIQKKVDANRQAFDNYGLSVDVEGDFAVVGMLGDDEDENEQNFIDSAGSAIVYKRSYNGNWDVYQKLVAPDRINGALFGSAVAIEEGQIFVAASHDYTDETGNNNINKSGSVYVYELVGSTWTFTQKIVAPDRGNIKCFFGWSLAVDSNLMIIGATEDPLEEDGITFTTRGGSVYFYEKNSSGVWNFVQKKVAFDRNGDDEYGHAVAISRDGRAVVGAPEQDLDENGLNTITDAGAIYIYEKTGAVWGFVQKKVLNNRSPDDQFGFAVGISDDRIVAGAPRHNVGTQVVGKIQVFERVNATTWNSLGTRVSNVLTNLSLGAYGTSIEMEGDKLFVGAPAESVGFTFGKGNVYLYEKSSSGPAGYGAGVPILPVPHNTGQVAFGNSIAVDDDKLIVGAIGDMTDENGANAIPMVSPPGLPDTDSVGAIHFFLQCNQANIPQISSSIPSAQICLGDSIQLVISGSSSLNSARDWYWYTGNYATGALVDSTDTIWVSPTVTTTYSVAGEGYCITSNASDSVGTITITVNATPTITANASPGTILCSGESVTLTGGGGVTYVWDNSVSDGVSFTPTVNGTYKVIGTDANGCVDSTTINLTVGTLPTVGINYTGSDTICSGTSITLSGTGTTSYSWDNGVSDGVAFTPTTTTTYTVTGTNASGCSNTEDTTIVVVAGPVVTASSGLTVICDGASVTLSAAGADSYLWGNGLGSGQSHTVSPSTTTSYTVTGTQNATGCTDSDVITIVVNNLPVIAANASPNDSLCIGESLTLTGSGATTYTWNNGVADGVAFIPNLGSTEYVVTATDANGCTGADTIDVEVFSLPAISASVSPSGSICSGDSVLLTGFGGVTYVWDSAGVDVGIVDNMAYYPPIGNNIVYTVTGTDVNGCVGTATQSITVNESPNVTAFSSAGGQSLCEGDTLELTALGNGLNPTWGNGVVDGVPFVPTVGTNLYTVLVTSANGCPGESSVSVLVNEQEDATITPVLPLCGGVPIQVLEAITPGGTWQGVGVDAVTGAFDAAIAGQGVHEIVYTTNGVCNASDTINIEVYPELVVVAKDDTVCFGDVDGEVSVEANGVAPYSYEWSTGETSSVLSEVGEGVYTVTVQDANNCVVDVEASVHLTESCDYHLFLPNVFSPNNDGDNDVFYVRGKGFESLKFVVFDRWGNKMFESTDKEIGWDGAFGGELVPSGVYVYYVEVDYYDGTSEIKEGNVCVVF
ncbi:MAG: gliding motility-associated C-terminal domain-containing protein [Flavobacteriales bacterium]|jgi:gliding motility-associated-like protein|nr:gliding motility-associated C-terminal domain-containing protein [Flavobacteriales bacterium]